MLTGVRRLLAPRWLVIHAVAAGLVLLFVTFGLWQLHRGESGNTRSYAYALEWPSFALLVIGFWVKLVRDEARNTSERAADADLAGPDPAPEPSRRSAARAADAAELAAYNRYLATRAGQRERT